MPKGIGYGSNKKSKSKLTDAQKAVARKKSKDIAKKVSNMGILKEMKKKNS